LTGKRRFADKGQHESSGRGRVHQGRDFQAGLTNTPSIQPQCVVSEAIFGHGEPSKSIRRPFRNYGSTVVRNMNAIIYLVGLVVVVGFVLSYLH
jgi:hypothetical protein